MRKLISHDGLAGAQTRQPRPGLRAGAGRAGHPGLLGLADRQPGPGQFLLAVGAPLALGVVWGLWLAPKAGRRLRGPALWAAQTAIFGLAALALAAAGQPRWAAILAILVVVNLGLAYTWHQE